MASLAASSNATCCTSPKYHPAEKLNRSPDVLTVKSSLVRPIGASWKAMKIKADVILARHSYKFDYSKPGRKKDWAFRNPETYFRERRTYPSEPGWNFAGHTPRLCGDQVVLAVKSCAHFARMAFWRGTGWDWPSVAALSKPMTGRFGRKALPGVAPSYNSQYGHNHDGKARCFEGRTGNSLHRR